MAKLQPSRRALASRQNGRLGGLKTAQTQSQEFLEQRAAKAGNATRDTYGTDYYRYLRSLHPNKQRIKSTARKIQETIDSIIPEAKQLGKVLSPKELMEAATHSLELLKDAGN